VSNQALIDGNERLGWLAAAVFLELDGVDIAAAANDDVDDLVIDVAHVKVRRVHVVQAAS
jgi:death-on-curing protein